MEQEIDTYERVIFRDLFSAVKPVHIFLFHEKYQLSPAQVYTFIAHYGDRGLVTFTNSHIQLSALGKKYVWANRFKLFDVRSARFWHPDKELKNWKEAEYIRYNRPHYSWIDKRFQTLNKEEFMHTIGRVSNISY